MPPLPAKPVDLPPLGRENPTPQPDWEHDFGFMFGARADLEEVTASWPRLYEDLQDARRREWEATVRAFEAEPDNFPRAWHYLNGHPVFWSFYGEKHPLAQRLQECHLEHEMGISGCVDVTVHERDGATWIMLEAGKREWPREPADPAGETVHRDRRLTSRAGAMEAAYIALARKVHEHYGNDRRQCGDPTPETADA